MTTDTATEHALTREEIKAIRNADSAVLRFERVPERTWEYTGKLELLKEVERGDGFGRDTLRVEIPTRTLITNHGGHGYRDVPDSTLEPAKRGDWVLLSLGVTPEWATFAHFLRTGDRLSQLWSIDNRNELLARAGLTAHEVGIRIERPIKEGTNARLYTFTLDCGVRDPRNLADAVRR